MSDINVYAGEGDAVVIEGHTQIIKMRGPKGDAGPAPDTSEFMVKDELEQIIIELKKINGGN